MTDDTMLVGRAWLMRGMAATAGVDFDRAIADGDLTQDEYDGMVRRCAECTAGETCMRWRAEGAPGAPDLPSYCLNHERIDALRPR
ncbi:MAG: DUF6455 family protein [Pseudomonadota bacterium]